MGGTSQGGRIEFVVSERRIRTIYHEWGAPAEPAGDCAGTSPLSLAAAQITQLRISINANGSFAARNIQIRGADRLLVEFSGTLNSDGTGYGRFQEDWPSQNPACVYRLFFEWNATRQ
jgi:hypothetical protein